MSSAPDRVPAISAHSGGSEHGPAQTYESYRSALAAGADYAEFDVRQTGDGTLVAFHERHAGRGRLVATTCYTRLCELAGYEVPRVAQLMRLLAGRAVGHLDVKEAGCAAAVTQLGLEELGPAGMIVTTGDSGVLATVKRQFPLVPVGLTIGGGGLARTLRLSARAARGSAWSRVKLAGVGIPDWVVIHHRLARAGALAECQHRGIKTMVWTVNADKDLVRWLAAPGVDALVTDRPSRAVFLRGQRLSPRAEGPR